MDVDDNNKQSTTKTRANFMGWIKYRWIIHTHKNKHNQDDAYRSYLVVFCCHLILVHLPMSVRLTEMALRQSHDCQSGSQASLSMMTSSNGNIFRVTGLCAGNSPVPVNSPHKGQWRGTLMFSLICVWINGWVNNREAGDLRRNRGHYDVIVME